VYDSYGVAANSGASVVDVLTPFDYLGDAVINIPDAIAATETMPLTIKLNVRFPRVFYTHVAGMVFCPFVFSTLPVVRLRWRCPPLHWIAAPPRVTAPELPS
jgi:hypothetical protein